MPSRSALTWLEVELSPLENGSSVASPSTAAFSRRQASSVSVYVVVGPIVGKSATKATYTTTDPIASPTGTHDRRSAASTSRPTGSAMNAARVCDQSTPA